MLLQRIAVGIDRAFLELSVRPTLPRLSMHRSFRKLLIAEQRTQSDIDDTALFCTSQCSLSVESAPVPNAREVREQRTTGILPSLPLAAKWGETGELQQPSARWYLRTEPRPLAILVGGWSPFRPVEPFVRWPVESLDRAGFDVAVPSLPWKRHGRREGVVTFPSADPCWNIVTMACVASALAQLVRHAKSQGHPSIVVCACSLGAHAVALLATLPEAQQVDRFLLEKPLGQLSDLVRWHARGDPMWCQHIADRLQRVYRSVCPLDRKPVASPEQMTIIGATFDQVTPIGAAQEVADHFQVPLRPIKASHLFDPSRTRRLLHWLTD
jgi:hypothetical protein